MKILLTLSILFIIGCNFDVNTLDPQVSNSLEYSKKDKLFLKEFTDDTTRSSCLVSEAWVEFSWINKLHYGKVLKTKPGGNQLALKFNPKTFSLDLNEYLWSWVLIGSTYGTFGRENGIFILDLNDKIIPNNFEIYLNKIRPNKLKVCKILLNANR